MTTRSAPSHDEIPLAASSPGWTALADVMGETWAIWQLPLVTALDMWGEAVDAQWTNLGHATGFKKPVHEHHNELIVPDILEEDHEHALFA
jgi:hypothetical protein